MTIKENFETDAGTINAGAARTVTRSFYVFPYTTWALADAAMHACPTCDPVGEGVDIGDTYVLGTNDSGVDVTATYWGTRSWSRVDGQSNTWVFNLEYTTSTSDSGSEVADISTQGDSRGSGKSVYRVGTFASTAFNDPTKADIGGYAVDSGGTPTSIPFVDRRFETTELKSSFPSLGALSSAVGTRNMYCHDGGGAGSILYTGFGWSLDTSSGMWSIKHTFAVDNLTYHCEQVAKTNPSGEVLTASYGTAPNAIYAASHVYFVQPFPLLDWGNTIPQFDPC